MGSPSATVAAEAYPTTDSCDGEDLTLPSPKLSQFEEGEKVLANHSGRFYEAKVLKGEYQVNEWKYLVHYVGWNKSWDEWLGLDRLMKHTDENVLKQQELGMKEGGKSAVAWRVSKMKPRSHNVQVARGRKRKQESVDSVISSSEQTVVPSNNVLTLNIPPALRKQLMDDCEFVTEMKLVQLPRFPTVDDILKKYCERTVQKHGRVSDLVAEILKGLRCYFDNALPVMLLYNNERKQYEEAVAADVSPSTIYGAEHLLRLFVKLPELICHVNIAEETMKELQDNFVDILRFLRKNQSSFFVAEYKAVEEMDKKDD